MIGAKIVSAAHSPKTCAANVTSVILSAATPSLGTTPNVRIRPFAAFNSFLPSANKAAASVASTAMSHSSAPSPASV